MKETPIYDELKSLKDAIRANVKLQERANLLSYCKNINKPSKQIVELIKWLESEIA